MAFAFDMMKPLFGQTCNETFLAFLVMHKGLAVRHIHNHKSKFLTRMG